VALAIKAGLPRLLSHTDCDLIGNSAFSFLEFGLIERLVAGLSSEQSRLSGCSQLLMRRADVTLNNGLVLIAFAGDQQPELARNI
jgi:hypothetical protein